MAAPDFWNDREKAEKISRQLGEAKKTIETWEGLSREHADLSEFLTLAGESEVADLLTTAEDFAARVREAELTLLLIGEYDRGDAILAIHAGAGGTDAADWAEMLLRMFLRYAEKKDWRVEIIEKSDAEEAGIRSAVMEIRGENAFGFLRGERGAHRLVRRSPFNSAGSRETSFAQVEVTPLLEDDDEIEIRNEDLKVDTFTASSAGGQHVNRTESAVRITHVPTGIVVSCQTQRSQHQNRDYALAMLRGQLAELQLREREKKEAELRGEAVVADFGGSTIRSYVLDDRRVKDARTGHETSNPDRVLDGDLDDFIRAWLLHVKK